MNGLDPAAALRLNPIAPLYFMLLAFLSLRAVHVMARDGSAARIGEGKVTDVVLKLLVVTFFLEIAVWGARFFGLFGGPVAI